MTLLSVAGAGNVMALTTGSAAMLKIQTKWNWKAGLKTIRYGCE